MFMFYISSEAFIEYYYYLISQQKEVQESTIGNKSLTRDLNIFRMGQDPVA